MDPGIFKLGRKIPESVCEALHSFGYTPKRKRVFIKPNIPCLYPSSSPCITDPRVVEGVIRYLQEIGIEDITLGEDPVAEDPYKVFRKSGYDRLCKKTGVKLACLNNVERRVFNVGGWRISIPRMVLDSEYINVAKLKTHMNTGVTLCLKNQKGLMTLPEKRSAHRNLHDRIAKLYSVVKPDLSIVDATSGVEGNGPGAGGKRVGNINLLVIGSNALKTDFLSTMLMGFDPKKIGYLKIASQGRRMTFPPETMEILSKYRMKFREPGECVKKFNLCYWSTDKTCSGCTEALKFLKAKLIRSPMEWPRFLYYAVLRRVDILSGNCSMPENCGKAICIGKCTEEFARKHGLVWVPGCPPKPEGILKAMNRKAI